MKKEWRLGAKLQFILFFTKLRGELFPSLYSTILHKQDFPFPNFELNFISKTIYIMQKPLFWLVLFIGLSYSLSAQSIERTVIGSAGNYQTNAAVGNLHWTVGEISVETYQNTTVLSQGFHQLYYDLLVTPVSEIPGLEFDVQVYPNPTTGWLNLETDLSGPLDLSVTNLLGQKLLQQHISGPTKSIDLAQFSAGIYLLSVSQNGQHLGTFKIQKSTF